MRQYLTYLDNESYLFWKIEVTGCSFTLSWGKVGTIGQSAVHIAENDEDCSRMVVDLLNEKKHAGYVTTGEGHIAKYNLPDVMRSAFTTERKVDSAAGRFVLSSFQDIKLISVVVDHHSIPSEIYRSALDGNPYRERKGLFCITAYSLVSKSPESYSESILLWLPLLELFGTWDRARRQLYVFPNVTWTDIQENLVYYLESSRQPERFPNILTRAKAMDSFDFIPDDLASEIKWILSNPEPVKLREAEEFLRRYEQRLLRHPWCAELEETYEALVTLYHHIGQVHEREAEYSLAIEWLGRSLPVVTQSTYFRSKIFIDIFIQLSFCYFETSQFDSSLRYMKMYQIYDTTAWDTCEQIIISISRVKQLYEEALATCRKAAEKKSEECYAEAIHITHRALMVSPNDPLLHFNLACFYSLSYKTKEALYHLEEAIKRGYDNHHKIVNEQDLEHIRGTREFEAIRQKYF